MRLGTMALISSCFRRFPMRLRMSKCVVDLYIARCSLPSALLTFFLLSFSHSLSVPLSLAERAAHRHIYRDAQRTRLRREGKDVDTAPLGVRSKRSRGVRVPRAPRWPRAANRRNASPQHAARRVEEAGAFAWRSAATRVVVACARRSTPSPLSPLPRPLSPLPPPRSFQVGQRMRMSDLADIDARLLTRLARVMAPSSEVEWDALQSNPAERVVW